MPNRREVLFGAAALGTAAALGVVATGPGDSHDEQAERLERGRALVVEKIKVPPKEPTVDDAARKATDEAFESGILPGIGKFIGTLRGIEAHPSFLLMLKVGDKAPAAVSVSEADFDRAHVNSEVSVEYIVQDGEVHIKRFDVHQ